jgi:AraC-like DNA-binding protein
MIVRRHLLLVRPAPVDGERLERDHEHVDESEAWSTIDPLGEALHLLRMSGVVYCRSEFTAPWGLELPPMPDCLMFHAVTSGRCWLVVEGDSRLLERGDFAIVPHGTGHLLSSEPGVSAARLFDLPREDVAPRYELLRHGGGGPATTAICGAVRFDHPVAQQLVRLLPPILAVDGAGSTHSELMHSVLRLLSAEARDLRPGGEAVITRLADILVIQAIRSWIERDPAARSGWLGALQDRQVGRALMAVHSDPAREWTVASLAADVAMSRSAFAARFAQLVGEPPMRYVARWRMQVAASLLAEGGGSVAELGQRLGYESEAAFSRAFKRIVGRSPGSVRGRSDGRRRQKAFSELPEPAGTRG